MKRQEVVSKLKAEARREKKERRRVRDAVATELGAAAPPKAIPDTMERTREVDDTVVLPGDAEVVGDEADDEFADLFAGDVVPRIMITTAPSPSGKIYRLIAEFMAILPNTSFYKRRKFPLKKICTWATDMGFTHLLVLGEKSKRANSLHIVNLPYGPTAAFRLSSSRLASQIPGHGTMTSHNPEVILTNFVTRLGRRVGRFLGSMYPRVRAGGGRGGHNSCTTHARTCKLTHPPTPPSCAERRLYGAARVHVPQPARLHLLPAAPVRVHGGRQARAAGGAGPALHAEAQVDPGGHV